MNTGSSSEYGRLDHAPSEDEGGTPDTAYGITKAAATALCVAAASTHTARIRTLRLYSAYGPYEDPRRLLPALVVHGLRGTLPPLVGPQTARDFVYVDDVVDALMLAAEDTVGEPGAIYNIGTGVQTTVGDAVESARRVMGIAAGPAWGTMPARAWDTDTWVADVRKSRDVLGWSARCNFEDGLRQMIAWLKSDPAMRQRYETAWPAQRLDDMSEAAVEQQTPPAPWLPPSLGAGAGSAKAAGEDGMPLTWALLYVAVFGAFFSISWSFGDTVP